MPTVARSIGLTAQHIASPKEGELLDILVQNLSANNVYVGSDSSVTTSNGVKLVPNGTYANDHEAEPIWLIADGAASDVRIKVETRKRVDW